MTFDLLLIGLAITLEPLPITGYILLVGSQGGTRKGFGFLVGWALCLVVVVVATLVLTGGKPLKTSSAPSTLALVIRILAGVLLLFLAWRQHKESARPKKVPSWQSNLNRVSALGAAGISVLLQPWTLVAAGAATVAQADASTPSTIVTLVGFGVLSTLSYLIMQTYAVVQPEQTRARLSAVQQWIDSHRDAAVIILCVVVGLWLIGKSAYLLTS
jgi:threonine/homoserine/homoserine lactone efflux protein